LETVSSKTAAALKTMRSPEPALVPQPSPVVGVHVSARLSSAPANIPSDDTPDSGHESAPRGVEGPPPGSASAEGQVRESVPPREASRNGATSCLADDEILQYRHGQASPALLRHIDEHLDRCTLCQELALAVIGDERELDASPSQITTFHEGFVIADRYRIERFLGRGGMGEVYAALDDLTEKRVALKTVLCTATDDPRAIRKLFGEVRSAQRVSHPNVFKIYDLHEHVDDNRGRVPFFTMEYIEGESLGVRLRQKGPLSIDDARPLAEQLLAGLAAAHAKGVLHLDFKSDNVLLRQSATGLEAVIMDFGLSRTADVESLHRTSERLQGAGTLPYMSIEQLECRSNVGTAADVYAFGVVLYEMLTGKLPFRADSMSALLLKQLTDRPVPPTRLVPGLSPTLEAFVLRCLSREASGRYENAGQALAALQSIACWQHVPKRRGFWPWAPLAAALLLALAACVHWRARTEPPHRPAPIATAAALEPAVAPSPGAAETPASPPPASEAAVHSLPPWQGPDPEGAVPQRAGPPNTLGSEARVSPREPPPTSTDGPRVSPASARPPRTASATPGVPLDRLLLAALPQATAASKPREAEPALAPPSSAGSGLAPDPARGAKPTRSAVLATGSPSEWRGPPPRAIPKPLPL
jgi:hypothetical protein